MTLVFNVELHPRNETVDENGSVDFDYFRLLVQSVYDDIHK